MLSHGNLLDPAEAFAAAEGIRASDEHVAYLPMAWVGNSLFSLALHMLVGFTCNFPEKPETLRRDLREIAYLLPIEPPTVGLPDAEILLAQGMPVRHFLGIAPQQLRQRCVDRHAACSLA